MTLIQHFQKALPEMGYDAFLLPRSDPYLNEFVSPSFEYLAFLTGFKGSTGVALVLEETVLLFVDERYTIQARLETSWSDVIVVPIKHFSLRTWLKNKRLDKGEAWRVGYDPRLHTSHSITQYETLHQQISLLPCVKNPLDAFWEKRPKERFTPLRPHPRRYRGLASLEKRQKIGALLEAAHADVLLVSSPEALAWTMNIRGDDLPYTPVALATLVLNRQGQGHLFTHDKPNASVLSAMGDEMRYHSLSPPLAWKNLAALQDGVFCRKKARVLFDQHHLSHWWKMHLEKAGFAILLGEDPIIALKAQKNKAEQEGMRYAHHQDGVALVQFFHWLEHAPSRCDEGMCVSRLAKFRAQGSEYLGASFPTIAATGAHGAIIHYIPRGDGERLRQGALFLCDSGGQYQGGTTDVTRTVCVGKCPTLQQQKDYTLVLQGHIDLARSVFDRKVSCETLDAIARAPLKKHGLSYAHGTGHGVGAALSVHEMPPGLFPGNKQSLLPGMTLSNEPGIYRQNHYGIRIESVMLTQSRGNHLGFETLTLCPMDASLILAKMLSQKQQDWLNTYHEHVFESLAPHLPKESCTWLKKATRKDIFKEKLL